MRRLARALLLAALAAGHAGTLAAQGVPDSEGGALGLLTRLESAWQARDLESYLGLWAWPDAETPPAERMWAQDHFSADLSELRLQRPASVAPGLDRVDVYADLCTIREPRGRIEQLLLRLERRAEGWVITRREVISQIDGLIHLSLDPQGYRADGLSIHFEDFVLELKHGTLFSSPASLGPTALAFVGEATVRFRPRPEAEREQLRQFSGKPELVERVRGAFIRIHPADLYKVLLPTRLEPDPDSAKRFGDAQRLFRQQGSNAFVLDTPLPGSPWWLLPSLGDSSITFEAGRRGTLTFTVSSSEPEGISLFDRGQRRQICLYPREGGTTRYNEDDGRAVDVLHHDLRVRFDPDREYLEGEDTLRLRPRVVGNTTVRLRLADGLEVQSVRSQLGSHLFFRVRGQDSLMVSLGPLIGRLDDYSLTIRYAGRLRPTLLDQELIQAGPPEILGPGFDSDDIPLERVLVYTNREPWHPQGSVEDYATARLRLSVPEGELAVTGGRRTDLRVEDDRVVSEYRLDQPGRYLAVAIGRLQEVGVRSEGPVTVHAYAVPRLRGEAAEALDRTMDLVRFYTERFGPCPYPSLNLVLTEARTPGGHSPPGMVILQNRPLVLRGALQDDPALFRGVPGFFLAHELAHQWWGHGLAGQNYRERWISEAGAQVAAVLWARAARGEDAFQEILEQMARWAERYADMGPIHLGFRLGHVKGDRQVFRALVYNKGAYVLLMLKDLVGEPVFFEALRNLFATDIYSKIGTEDVREALEAASGLDLRPYFEAWVYGTRLPQLYYRLRQEKARPGAVSVEVRAENLPGPVPLAIELRGRSRYDEHVMLPAAGGVFEFEVPERISKVELNPDRALLARVKRF